MDEDMPHQMYDAAAKLLDELADREDADADTRRCSVLLSFWTGYGRGAEKRAEAAEAEVKRLRSLLASQSASGQQGTNPYHAHGEIEGPRKAPELFPGAWTQELETTREELCAYLVVMADDSRVHAIPGLTEALREAEAVLTTLGDIATRPG